MLAPLLPMLEHARAGGHGVLAGNVIGLEHAEALVRGAEAERAPVILQLSQNAVRYRLGLVEPIAAACQALAEAATVPVALHLDHATTRDLCARAVAAGFGSIMFDASADDEDTNIARTRDMAGWAHAAGVAIEGEIGEVGGKEGAVTTDAGMTDPAAAARYVAATGVDTLAVAIGSEHGMARTRRLDLDRLAAIRAAVTVPLVLHGSSGVPDADLAAAVRAGITKVNLATRLNGAWTDAVRAGLAADAAVSDPRRYGAPAREAMVEVVREMCGLLGASGQA